MVCIAGDRANLCVPSGRVARVHDSRNSELRKPAARAEQSLMAATDEKLTEGERAEENGEGHH